MARHLTHIASSIEVLGVKRLNDLMKTMGKDFALESQRGMYGAAGGFLGREMRARCPVGPTGNLKRSIRTKIVKRKDGDGGYIAWVGPWAPHAHLIHMGHRVMVPREGYGGKLIYWREYWARKMYGQFIPTKYGEKTRENRFVSLVGDVYGQGAIAKAGEYLGTRLKKYETSFTGEDL